MSLERLRDACARNNIKTVGFVDDIFDVPAAAGLERASYRRFVRGMKADEAVLRNDASAEATAARPLPDFDDLDDEDLEPFWKLLLNAKLAGKGAGDAAVGLARTLFEGHNENALGMLDTVASICRLFEEQLGCKVAHFGRHPDYVEVASKDLVLIDFFLEANLAIEAAFAMTVDVVRNIRNVDRSQGKSPSFVLVSSRPGAVKHEDFRRSASLLRSRFRFVSKDDLGKASGAHLLDLHDVFEAQAQASEIENLIDDWKRAAVAAAEDVRSKMLEFDVSDFVYLDCFRLYREGTSLGTYLRWLMTAYLQAKVPDYMDRGVWSRAESLRLFDVARQPTGRPEEDALVKAFQRPGQTIGEAYGAILVDHTRSTATPFPVAPLAADLLEGDLFVDRRQSAGYADARVLLVMTPTCDLAVRGGKTSPPAKTVLFLPGTLHLFLGEIKPREIGDIEFVRVLEPSAEGRKVARTYKIEWDLKEVTSRPWQEIANGGLSEMDRLGRIREPYINHVRDRFVNGVTRIGREVSPLFPTPRGGEVRILVPSSGKKQVYAKLFQFNAESGFVWAFQAVVDKSGKKEDPNGKVDPKGPAAVLDEVAVIGAAAAAKQQARGLRGDKSAPNEPKSEEKTLYHVTRDFLTLLRTELSSLELPHQEQRAALVSFCDSFDFWMAMLQPGRTGPRSIAGWTQTMAVNEGSSETNLQGKAELMLVLYKADA